MMLKARLLGLTICFLLLPDSTLLQAGVIPGRWEKVDAQAPGTGLTVIMKSGDRFDCAFKELQMDTLVVETSSGERRIPKVDIQRLETSELVSDPVRDGTLTGLGIGAGAGGILGALVGAAVGGIWGDTGDQIKGALIVGAVGAGIGAGAGAAIGFTVDYAVKHKRPEVLYVAN